MLSLVGSGRDYYTLLWESRRQTSGSEAQCNPSPGNEMIFYFSAQLIEKLGGLNPPNLKSGRA